MIRKLSDDRSLKVEKIEPITKRINLFTLVSADGEPLAAYEAGAHIDFDLGDAGTRSYSLIDFPPPAAEIATYQIAVQREDDGQGGSLAMHKLAIGDTIKTTPPKNDFRLQEGPNPALLIAGGIGVTPIISFATECTRKGSPFAFHYATRNSNVCPFRDILEQQFGANLTLWFDDEKMIDVDGVIKATSADTHIYCCGPKPMIEAVRERAEAAGFPADQIHFELFATPTPMDGDQPFEVELESTGRVFTIPAGKTIIEVLEEANVDVMYDCARGDCGICQTDVISGTPDHRDVVLSDSERASGKVMQICVSRAKSPRLVLDI